jgi:hypothetical protein
MIRGMTTAADKLATKLATLTGKEEAAPELRVLLEDFEREVVGNLAGGVVRAARRLEGHDPALVG